MQRSASDIFWALLVSGDHSILFDRLDHFDSMNHPHEEGKAVQSTESSHSDDPVDLTMSTAVVSMASSQLHVPLHLNSVAPPDNPEPVTDPHHQTKKPPRKRKWRKPKDMPKRPLSAYNIFFQNERKKLADEKSALDAERASSSSMGFAGLAQNVATKWRSLDPSSRAYFEAEAGKDQVRYRQEVEEWKRRKEERKVEEADEHEHVSSFGASKAGDTTSTRGSNTSFFLPPHNAGSPSTQAASPRVQALSLWPSMPQTIESLGNLYDANVDFENAQQESSGPSQQQESTVTTENLEPLPINPSQGQEARTSHHGETATVGSSLHQLFTGMEEEELDFLMSLRDLK